MAKAGKKKKGIPIPFKTDKTLTDFVELATKQKDFVQRGKIHGN